MKILTVVQLNINNSESIMKTLGTSKIITFPYSKVGREMFKKSVEHPNSKLETILNNLHFRSHLLCFLL